MKKITDLAFKFKNVLFRKQAVAQYHELLKNIKDDDTLKRVNWTKRIALVRYAYENIPFYNKYYKECGFSPNMLKSEKDWDLIPVLEKKYIINDLEAFTPPKK